jgi:hypothetical protein
MKTKFHNYNLAYIGLGIIIYFGIPVENTADLFGVAWDSLFAGKIYYRLENDVNYYDLRLKDVYSEFDPQRNPVEIAIKEKETKDDLSKDS